MQKWIPWVGMAMVIGMFGLMMPRQEQARAGLDDKKKDEKRTITAAGSTTVRMKPDHARVYFSVQTVKPSIKAARDANSMQVKKVQESLKALEIPDLKTKTSDVNVEIVYSHQREQDRLPDVLGYRLTNSFTVLANNFDMEKLSKDAGRILDTALENGATNVQQIQFFKEKTTNERHEGLAMATREAIENARAMAKGADVKITETVTIVEQGEQSYAFNNRNFQMAQNVFAAGVADGSDTPVNAGMLEVTYRVTITCAY